MSHLLPTIGVFAWAVALATLGAAGKDAPMVGAIRWDAWYGETGPVKHVERSLGQPKYHFRLPWFARVDDAGGVRINGDQQEIIELEIAYAAGAGLDYWAFVDYWDDPNLGIALRRFRAAKDKQGLRYCLIEEGARLDGAGSNRWEKLIGHFTDPAYQTVLDGRPLLFLLGKPKHLGAADWRALGDASVAAGMKRPYLVFMGWHPASDATYIAELGFDAVSAYARGGSYSMRQPSYAEQCELIRRDRWEVCSARKIPSVTFASAGWDTRPRNERPPPWIHDVVATPDTTPPAQQKPLLDAVTATPDQLAAHIRAAVEWTQRNRDINPANAVIIYGWNENDEGGWLIPTRGADGRPDDARIKAVGAVLRGTPESPMTGKP